MPNWHARGRGGNRDIALPIVDPGTRVWWLVRAILQPLYHSKECRYTFSGGWVQSRCVTHQPADV